MKSKSSKSAKDKNEEGAEALFEPESKEQEKKELGNESNDSKLSEEERIIKEEGYTMDEIVVKFDFNLYGKNSKGTDQVDYKIWFTNSDPHSIRLLRHLNTLLYQLERITDFTPGIVTWDCN